MAKKEPTLTEKEIRILRARAKSLCEKEINKGNKQAFLFKDGCIIANLKILKDNKIKEKKNKKSSFSFFSKKQSEQPKKQPEQPKKQQSKKKRNRNQPLLNAMYKYFKGKKVTETTRRDFFTKERDFFTKENKEDIMKKYTVKRIKKLLQLDRKRKRATNLGKKKRPQYFLHALKF